MLGLQATKPEVDHRLASMSHGSSFGSFQNQGVLVQTLKNGALIVRTPTKSILNYTKDPNL